MGAAAVGLYAFEAVLVTHDPEIDHSLFHTRAMAFSLLALSPLFHAWSCRSPVLGVLQTRPLFSLPLFLAVAASAAIHLVAVLVPSLRPVFHTYAMSGSEWLLLLGLAALIVPAVEVAKMVYRRARPDEAAPPPPSSIYPRRSG
jgi:Ca2+-transporting ATPase